MSQTKGNRTDKFLKNVLGSAILQIVTIITGFISPRLMLLAFGSEINGITSSITQFISYLTLVEAGLSNATIFALYKPLASGNAFARDSVISASKRAYYRIGMIFVGMSIVLAIAYPFIGNTDSLNNMELSLLVIVLCSNSTINFFVLAKYRTLLTADQCGYCVSLASAIQLIMHLLLIYIGIKCHFGVVVVRAMGMFSLLFTSLFLAVVVKRKYGYINYNAEPNMDALDKRWDAMVLQIMGIVNAGAPVVIMTAILNYKLISVYAIYNMIAGSVSSCISVFTSGLSASFGNIYAIGDKNLLKKTTEEFRVGYYCLITILYSTMITTLIPFISIYTEGINDVNYILPIFGVLITINGLIDNLRAPHGMLTYSFGKFHIIRKASIIQVFLVISLSVTLIKMYGLIGCMVALIIANIYMLVVMLRLAPKELVQLSVAKNVRQIVQSITIVVLMYIITIRITIAPNNYMQWVGFATLVFIVSGIVTIAVFYTFDKDEMRELRKRISNYLSNKIHKK